MFMISRASRSLGLISKRCFSSLVAKKPWSTVGTQALEAQCEEAESRIDKTLLELKFWDLERAPKKWDSERGSYVHTPYPESGSAYEYLTRKLEFLEVEDQRLKFEESSAHYYVYQHWYDDIDRSQRRVEEYYDLYGSEEEKQEFQRDKADERTEESVTPKEELEEVLKERCVYWMQKSKELWGPDEE